MNDGEDEWLSFNIVISISSSSQHQSTTGLLPKAAAQAWHEEVAAKEAALRKLLMNPQYNTADKRCVD